MLDIFIKKNGVDAELIPLAHEVRTVSDAVKATGIPAENHAKSILFICSNKEPVVVVLLGTDRVDYKKLKELMNVKDVRLAEPDEVEEITGFEVGGVPPIGFYGVKTIVDPDVLKKDKVACGGGDIKTEMIIKAKHIEEFGYEVEVADVKREN
ncbi:MAG: YbaK/EbsC family protein [Candidatus Diapherotrites archaeon]